MQPDTDNPIKIFSIVVLYIKTGKPQKGPQYVAYQTLQVINSKNSAEIFGYVRLSVLFRFQLFLSKECLK